ncbi:rhodanese-like domain-containing protein [Halovivax cerinus]|uniref:Rhodanese-like domain-containing protein n=1 Tax=Halovivax cerinus TaxID=1487865 RepID=A0ABD5NRV7_9EURY|nr:rhodanese-like domain-containing protein [Halovivax cerinus]
MKRRTYLATAGSATAGVVLGGCLSDDEEDRPPHPGTTLSDPSEYDVSPTGGYNVPLAPLEDVYGSYLDDDELLVLDARGEPQYQQSHISGAKLSPAGRPGFDHPTTDVATDRRIVTYCTCPHHLSTARAAELYSQGFQTVYAIDEGFGPWVNGGYPTDGSGAAQPLSYAIEGVTDPSHAGEQVWLREPETHQQYVARIDDDGSWAMHFEFVDVDDETLVELALPDRTVEDTLGDLSGRTVQL